MFSKLQAAVVVLCATTYAAAGTTVLGTASARGAMRVDGYAVQGDATVFNGSVVQTQAASAQLRVAHGVDITLSKSSRGTVYGNRFVLQRGETEISAPGSFALEANGLHVTSAKPHSVGVVALTHKNQVEVSALSGGFEVRDGHGLLLSEVIPGQPLAFAKQTQVATNQTEAAPSQTPTDIAPQFLSIAGMLSSENGHFYLTSDRGVKFELTGKGRFQNYVGDKVFVRGQFQPTALAGGAVGTISVKTIEINGGGTTFTKKDAWIITGAALAGAGTVGFVVHNALKPPASR